MKGFETNSQMDPSECIPCESAFSMLSNIPMVTSFSLLLLLLIIVKYSSIHSETPSWPVWGKFRWFLFCCVWLPKILRKDKKNVSLFFLSFKIDKTSLIIVLFYQVWIKSFINKDDFFILRGPQATAGHHCNQTHPPPPYRRIVPGTRQKGSNEYLRHLRPRVWPISKSIFLRCWGHAGTWSESSPSLVEVHHHYLFSFLYFNYLLLQEREVTSPLLDKTLPIPPHPFQTIP